MKSPTLPQRRGGDLWDFSHHQNEDKRFFPRFCDDGRPFVNLEIACRPRLAFSPPRRPLNVQRRKCRISWHSCYPWRLLFGPRAVLRRARTIAWRDAAVLRQGFSSHRHRHRSGAFISTIGRPHAGRRRPSMLAPACYNTPPTPSFS
ncbi:hypothetical protein TRVL_05518 [Trypanosoma vivax]|nr:hypothetical protein TRVL_05518 [Trypanosoma vivax]